MYFRFVALGTVVGACIGMAMCFVLSDGKAAGRFYMAYGLFGAGIGLVGVVPAGLVIAIAHAWNRRKMRERS